MKPSYKLLAICIAIPLGVGALSALLTQNAMQAFQNSKQPPLSPPGILFPIVWIILYSCMGISSYYVLTSDNEKKDIFNALFTYGLQLVFNFCWSIWFFNFNWYLFAFVWLLVLWIAILNTITAFYELSQKAAILLIPYLLWVTFAGYLNLAIYFLNK